MPKEQILIGAVIAVLCGIGLCKDRWFLTNTKKGRQLIDRFGQRHAIWVLRLLFGAGAVFGILFASGVIRPVQW